MRKSVLFLTVTVLCAGLQVSAQGGQVKISAKGLVRSIRLDHQGFETTSLSMRGKQVLAETSEDFRVRFAAASPNRKPRGLKPGQGEVVDGGVEWTAPVVVNGSRCAAALGKPAVRTTHPDPASTRMLITAGPGVEDVLAGVTIVVVYETYQGYPAVRKWIEVSNGGGRWLKIDNLLIDSVRLAAGYGERIPLTPAERGAGSSLVAMTNRDGTTGVIAGSEIPSALRMIHDGGSMGYAEQHFEWVLGPGEKFQSEPVFFFGFDGRTVKYGDVASRPVDRAVEGLFQRFLRERIGLAVAASALPGPVWVTWSNFGPNIDDAIIREQAPLAARAGFSLLAFDDGWQRGRLGTETDLSRFPDLAATSAYVRSLGLRIGLWLSCFRTPEDKEMREMPEAASLPPIRRMGGLGMSFASSWRDYYVRDLLRLNKDYGVTYFKQDFTNIKFGDIAEGHESRTRKESLLRGLRGLLRTQEEVRRLAPGVAMEVTHEIYWGTPGVPCDLAALQHASLYHIPPNDYSGAGSNKLRYDPAREYDTAALRNQLIAGCYHARQRFYAHRGLPLNRIEYYAAATFNARGSLTPRIQDRQICSWLMGAPLVFAGDLSSLTPENIASYRLRFDLLKRLERDYGIYRHFQFSGAPAPTDEGWHWWGKLNERKEGVVVVIRGSDGPETQLVSIPWVDPAKRYEVTALLEGRALGSFTGRRLRNGGLALSLPAVGQEILELKMSGAPVR